MMKPLVTPLLVILGQVTAAQPPEASGHLVLQVMLGLLFVLALAMILYSTRLRRKYGLLLEQLGEELEERRKANRALQNSEAVYYSLVETLPQAILRKDMDGKFTFANSRFCTELGRSLEDMQGKTDFDFFPAEFAEKYRRDDQRVIETGETLDVVEQHVTPHGEKLYVQVIKTPVLGRDGKPMGIQGIFWDVTARKRAEEQLQEQNRLLEEMARSEHEAHQALKATQSRMVQSEKLASLGQTVAGVAHEINNPLAFVINNVAVLERDLSDVGKLHRLYREAESKLAAVDPQFAEEVRNAREAVDLDYTIENLPGILCRTREGLKRIQRIVADLRLFARIDETELNEVDLNEGIESSLTIIEGLASKRGVTLKMDLEPLPHIRCFGAKINHVVINLLSNAIDACGHEGEVLVRTRPEPRAVAIEVIDNGCGIPSEIRDKIFDPFFTTKQIGQGTGLGLSISYGIVQEHGGTIEVESEPGKGSRFTVHLPMSPTGPR